MAFEKNLELMRLAEMAAARHKGVSLVEMSAEFGVNLRTAQRMIRSLTGQQRGDVGVSP